MEKAGNYLGFAGQQIGRWSVEKFSHMTSDGHAVFACKCACGNERFVKGAALKRGTTKSCGCLRSELSAEKLRTHGLSKHRLFPTWDSMMQRCYNSGNTAFPRYGGRGIQVCERWHEVANFIADMSQTFREGLTIDREDNDGPYSPCNTRWASRLTQSLNRRSNVTLTYDGKTMSLFEWAREIGIPPRTLWARINKGWPTQDALTIPASKTLKRVSLVEFEGVTTTVYEHAKARGITPTVASARIRKGWTLDQAFNTPVALRKRR